MNCYIYGKNNFAEASKNLARDESKNTLLNYQSNYVEILSIFRSVSKFLNTLAKSSFPVKIPIF